MAETMSKVSSSQDGHRACARIETDAHGQAALLLVESLLHGLLGRGLLTVEDTIDITTDAADVKEEIILQGTESDETAQHSLQLIARIAATLKIDRKLPADRLDSEKMANARP